MTAKSIHIKREPDGRLTLSFYYEYTFIEKLKAAVPAGDREYHPDKNHIWVILDPKYEAEICKLAEPHFESAVLEYKDTNNDLVTVNLKTGGETRMGSLF